MLERGVGQRPHGFVALSLQHNLLPSMHPSLEEELEFLLLLHRSSALALLTAAIQDSGRVSELEVWRERRKNARILIPNLHSLTSTQRASNRHPSHVRTHLLHRIRLPLPVTPHTRLRLPPRLRSRPFAPSARPFPLRNERLLAPHEQLLERNRQLDLRRCGLRLPPLSRTSTHSWRRTAESSPSAEHLGEEVLVRLLVHPSSTSSAPSLPLLRVSQLVILSSRVGVGEDFESVLDFEEEGGVGWSVRGGLLVRVVLESLLAVRLLDLGGRGIWRNSCSR